MDENGEFAEGLYHLHRRHKGQLRAQEDLQSIIQACEWASEQESRDAPSRDPSKSKKKGQGKQRGHFPKKRDANGNLVVAISHTDTG
jgi:hypothetical protein